MLQKYIGGRVRAYSHRLMKIINLASVRNAAPRDLFEGREKTRQHPHREQSSYNQLLRRYVRRAPTTQPSYDVVNTRRRKIGHAKPSQRTPKHPDTRDVNQIREENRKSDEFQSIQKP